MPPSPHRSIDAWVLNRNDTHSPAGVAWWGPLLADEVAAVARAVAQDCYPHSLPDVPWAMALQLPDGGVRVACHPMLDAGVFVASRPNGDTAIGLTLRGVHLAKGGEGTLDKSWLQTYHKGKPDRYRSPLTGVSRVPPGESATMRPDGSMRRTIWCGPEVWPKHPELHGRNVERAYLTAFDHVTESLTRRAGRLTATVSGGLDSTFVAASLALHRQREPIAGLVYAPMQGFRAPRTPYVADDLPWAQQMARQYPGVFRLLAVQNDTLVHPLDAAAHRMEATWWPVFGAANSVWIQKVEQYAVDHGSRLIFGGFHGNASFSWHHRHAAAYCIDRRQWASLYRIAERPNAPLSRRLASLRQQALDPLRRYRRAEGTSDQQRFLDFLAGRLHTHHAHPYGLELLRADPFRSRSILTLAAQIHPAEWRRRGAGDQLGPDNRAFARRLGAGRVPDPIRLRAARGLQASDAWLWVHNSQERIQDEIAAITSNVLARDLIDVPLLRSFVSNWNWADPQRPPPHSELAVVLRELAFADYCLTMPGQLAQTQPSPR